MGRIDWQPLAAPGQVTLQFRQCHSRFDGNRHIFRDVFDDPIERKQFKRRQFLAALVKRSQGTAQFVQVGRLKS